MVAALMLTLPAATAGMPLRTLRGPSNTKLFNHLLLNLRLDMMINMMEFINHNPTNIKQDVMINIRKTFNHHLMNIRWGVRSGICERRPDQRRTSSPITPSTRIARCATHPR